MLLVDSVKHFSTTMWYNKGSVVESPQRQKQSIMKLNIFFSQPAMKKRKKVSQGTKSSSP